MSHRDVISTAFEWAGRRANHHRSVKVTRTAVVGDREDVPIYLGDLPDGGAVLAAGLADAVGLPDAHRDAVAHLASTCRTVIVGRERTPEQTRIKLYFESAAAMRTDDQDMAPGADHIAVKWTVGDATSAAWARYAAIDAPIATVAEVARLLGGDLAAARLVSAAAPLLDALLPPPGRVRDVLVATEDGGTRRSVDIAVVAPRPTVTELLEVASVLLAHLGRSAADVVAAVPAGATDAARVERLGLGRGRDGEPFVTIYYRMLRDG